MPSLRSVAEVGLHAGRRPDLHRLRRPHLRLRRPSCTPPTAWPTPCASGSAWQKGDRVAVLSQNNPEWCLTFWATVSQGAVLVGPQRLVDHRRDRSTACRTPGPRSSSPTRSASSASPARSTRCRTSSTCSSSTAPPPTSAWPTTRGCTRSPSSPARPRADFVDQEIAEDDAAVIFYTSGTTGRPKGAISTHRSMIANLQNTMYGAVAGSMVGRRLARPTPVPARTCRSSRRRCSTCPAATRRSWSGSSPASSS